VYGKGRRETMEGDALGGGRESKKREEKEQVVGVDRGRFGGRLL
jgi:hypothetical protein